jgi:hypothetical protein
VAVPARCSPPLAAVYLDEEVQAYLIANADAEGVDLAELYIAT